MPLGFGNGCDITLSLDINVLNHLVTDLDLPSGSGGSSKCWESLSCSRPVLISEVGPCFRGDNIRG